MLQETVTWFSAKGSPQTFTSLHVSAGVEPKPTTVNPPRNVKREVAQTVTRLVLWQTAFTMFRERPLLGFGPDKFRWLYGKYAGMQNANTTLHANNMYIEWLVDTGLLGLAAFLFLSWRLLHTAVIGLNRLEDNLKDNALSIYQLALIGSLIAWYVHGLLDFFYAFTPTYMAFWFVAGLAAVPMYRSNSTLK
jgi:putative inorganic carbon (HCO3(-)) transporter